MLSAGRNWFLLVLVSLFAWSAEAQSRLNFPRVLSPQELRTTGFALVNTSSSQVAANFYLYGNDGQLAGSATLNVPAGKQVSKLGSEILISASVSGWVQVTSSSSELQGFEIVGDFATVADGAGPAPESTQLSLIDFSREDVIHIVNPGSQSGTVQVTLYSANGETLGTRSIPLTPFQPASLRLGDVNDDDNIDLVSLSGGMAISASMTTKLAGGRDVAVTNATPASGSPLDLIFPFALNGPQGASNWTTFVGVANLASTSQTVSLVFTADGGSPVTIQRNLAPHASVGDSVTRLFSLPNTLTAGWLRVFGSGSLTGVVAYQDSATGSLATVPSQSLGANRFFFGHIASLGSWYTGIALLNTASVAANAEVFAIDAGGQLVGSPATFSLAGGGRRSVLLSELVPQLLQRSSDGGFVFVRTSNSIPLLGFEIFGHATAPIIANVQGFSLPSTSLFVPPGGGSTGAPVTVDRVSFTDGTTSKTQFQPKDDIVYDVTVTNSTGASVSAQVAYSVKDPRGQGLFTTSAPRTLAAGTSDLTFSGFVPSNALNGQYTFTATVTYQTQTATKSANFEVSGGTTTPSLGQESPLTASTSDSFQAAFRPGDTVRFVILTVNFATQATDSTLEYQLDGPAFPAGAGSLSYTVPTGIGARTIDIRIPDAAPLGLYAFSSKLTGGGTTSTKGTAITVAPKSSSETADIHTVFVADSAGVPKAAFTPGSSIRLYVGRLSSFAVTLPVTVRYTVTGPNSSNVLDQPLAVNLPTGLSAGSIPLTLGGSAGGSYTFQATLTYLDNTGATKTSTLSTQFTVAANPPSITQTVSARAPNLADINAVTRTSFSPGEDLVLIRTVYSTFNAPVSGTVEYELKVGQIALYNQALNATFNPGLNTSFIVVTGTGSLQAGSYAFNVAASAQGQRSTASATFSIAGPRAPQVNFSSSADDAKRSPADKQIHVKVQEMILDTSVDDRWDSADSVAHRQRWLLQKRD